jgi:hypothetical protein
MKGWATLCKKGQRGQGDGGIVGFVLSMWLIRAYYATTEVREGMLMRMLTSCPLFITHI